MAIRELRILSLAGALRRPARSGPLAAACVQSMLIASVCRSVARRRRVEPQGRRLVSSSLLDRATCQRASVATAAPRRWLPFAR